MHTEPKSWRPVVKVYGDDKWHGNALRFATQEEAMANARDLHGRWMATIDYAAQTSDDPPNYRWDAEKGLVSL